MWRSTSEIENDQKSVDLEDLSRVFRGSFNPSRVHDALKFLSHVLNQITHETVEATLIKAWKKGQDEVLNKEFFKQGILNKCFGISQIYLTKCKEKGHSNRMLEHSLFLCLSSGRETLK